MSHLPTVYLHCLGLQWFLNETKLLLCFGVLPTLVCCLPQCDIFGYTTLRSAYENTKSPIAPFLLHFPNKSVPLRFVLLNPVPLSSSSAYLWVDGSRLQIHRALQGRGVIHWVFPSIDSAVCLSWYISCAPNFSFPLSIPSISFQALGKKQNAV